MEYRHPFHNDSLSSRNSSTNYLGGIRIVSADRQPCPVCGHPTGDCASDVSSLPKTNMPSQMNGSEPMILVEQDVTEERMITPYTKARVLIHRVGDYIPLSKARELGLVK